MFWHNEQNQCETSSNLLLAHLSGTFLHLPKSQREAEKSHDSETVTVINSFVR